MAASDGGFDALLSITCDEDLVNVIEKYEQTASPPSALKIGAFLAPPESIKKISPPPSSVRSRLRGPGRRRSAIIIGASARSRRRWPSKNPPPSQQPPKIVKGTSSKIAAEDLSRAVAIISRRKPPPPPVVAGSGFTEREKIESRERL
ncbi:hypothetical protein L484_006349 [Morus notabilis]|uniref:PB1 domain-containing protein n=1 Tax=Morus notabilis TaxID=981085 RepID=W9RBR1_9ROSA|nr:hypothetical protein L484_006349 [Morus notabilis]